MTSMRPSSPCDIRRKPTDPAALGDAGWNAFRYERINPLAQ
jgi:hypothetical protein